MVINSSIWSIMEQEKVYVKLIEKITQGFKRLSNMLNNLLPLDNFILFFFKFNSWKHEKLSHWTISAKGKKLTKAINITSL